MLSSTPQPAVSMRPTPVSKARIFAVLNQKGGVGKTTTTVNLAAALAERGKRILVIDLDPQAHATIHLIGLAAYYDLKRSIYDVLTDAISCSEGVISTEVDGLSIIPSHLDLSAAESELASAIGRESLLRVRLEEVAQRFDYTFIDCPPTLGLLALNALAAGSDLLIPVAAEFLALQGMTKLMKTITLVQRHLGHSLSSPKVLITRFDGRRNLAQEVVERVRSIPHIQLLETRVRENVRLAEAPSRGLDIFRYDPKSTGAVDYRAVAEEVLRHG